MDYINQFKSAKKLLLIILIGLFSNLYVAQVKTIHVFVALCDNDHQGIVPVPESLGNGKDPNNNLYWGATFGIKSYFKNKATNWKFITGIKSENSIILERLLFKHTTKDIYLLADAYDGEEIKTCIEDFLKASNGQKPVTINSDSIIIPFGGEADLIAYVGHDGLMDFNVDIQYLNLVKKPRDVIILACFSKRFFSEEIKSAKANPLLWTTHLMAPEAYTLKSAVDGWMLNETGSQLEERAAQTYHKYQKCGIKGARNLFATGY